MCGVGGYPVTPSTSVLREGGTEDAEEKVVVASVGGGLTSPPGVEPGHLGLSAGVNKHSLRLSVCR